MAADAPTAFFSYSREDSVFAQRLAKDLKAAGTCVWLDQLDIAPGQRWARAVQDALTNSRSVLVILSPASVNSGNVEDEYAYALEKHKTVIPVLYRDCKIPYRLSTFQYADFRSDYALGLTELLKTLGVEQQLTVRATAPIESGRERFSDHNKLRQQIAPIRPGQVHPQNLPYLSLGKLFKGRESFLNTIREHLLAQSQQPNGVHASAVTQPQVLCGLGGIGKTRLAVEYGWRYADEYSAVLFVVADSPENLRRNLAQLTGSLVLNLPEQNRQEEEVKMAAAIRWLLEHPGWFLILDNVDTHAAAEAVEELLARIPSGHVLITSKLGDWSKDVEPLELDVLSSEDATSFLLDRTRERRRVTQRDDKDASILAQELDGLALALEQAGAFIERQRCSIGDYLNRWTAGESRVRQWFDPRLMHYPRSVAITYDSTMLEVGSAAAALFHLLSWFAPDPLPQGVAENARAATILAESIHGSDKPKLDVIPEEALAELAAFSMIKRVNVEGIPCISQHRLVQEITQERILPDEKNPSLLGAVDLLVDSAPKDSYRPEVWKEWRLLVPHAEALWAKVKYLSRDQWKTPLMDGLALYYLGQERYADAIPIQRLALELKCEHLGSTATEALLAKNDLALTLNSSGESTEAQRLYREALQGWEVVENRESLYGFGETLHNLGFSLLGTGQVEEAESTLRRALDMFRNKSGEFHWRTLMTEFSLAQVLLAKGEIDAAVALLRQNIEKKVGHLEGGENHPDTLNSIQTLAAVRFEQGDLNEAESLAKRAIVGRGQSLGEDHPRTLESVALLAAICAQANKPGEAQVLRDRLIDTALRLGTSTSLLSVRQIALNCFVNCDYAQAEALLRRLLERRFEVPSNHCHLARVLLMMDRREEAQLEIAEAWEHRASAPLYVIPRIIWFQIALASCQNAGLEIDRAQLKTLLGRIKTPLQSDEAFMEWTITPVVEHLKPKLSQSDYALLTSLAAALNNRAKLSELDGFPEWSSQPSIPLDAFSTSA